VKSVVFALVALLASAGWADVYPPASGVSQLRIGWAKVRVLEKTLAGWRLEIQEFLPEDGRTPAPGRILTVAWQPLEEPTEGSVWLAELEFHSYNGFGQAPSVPWSVSAADDSGETLQAFAERRKAEAPGPYGA
jgi:hypothetical protein